MMPGNIGFPSFIRRMRFCRISSFTETMRAPDFLSSPTVFIVASGLWPQAPPSVQAGAWSRGPGALIVFFLFLAALVAALLALGEAEGHNLVGDQERRELVDHDLDVVGVRLF